jgi:hypothetical protein
MLIAVTEKRFTRGITGFTAALVVSCRLRLRRRLDTDYADAPTLTVGQRVRCHRPGGRQQSDIHHEWQRLLFGEFVRGVVQHAQRSGAVARVPAIIACAPFSRPRTASATCVPFSWLGPESGDQIVARSFHPHPNYRSTDPRR